MDTFIATITKGEVNFGSEYNLHRFKDFKKKNEGCQIEIKKKKKPVSEDMRGYYFGAVIPVLRSTCVEWEKLDAYEIHEIVKKMLFYFEAYNPKTKRAERFGRPVMRNSEWTNTFKAMQFLEIIRQYLADCGLEMPDATEYKNERDSAPMLADEN